MSKDISEKEYKTLNRMRDRAEKIVSDHSALKTLLEKTKKKLDAAQEDDSLMEKLVEYLKLITRMIANYSKGVYRETPWQTLVMLIAGILYFVTPFDAIPDFIPVAGLLDDATVLVWIGKCFREDIANYRNWEVRQHSKA